LVDVAGFYTNLADGPETINSPSQGKGMDPKGFLLGVMNDPAVELHLRIEAAKALLPYF